MGWMEMARWLAGLAAAELLIIALSVLSLQSAARVVARSCVARRHAAITVLVWHIAAAVLAIVIYSPQLFALITGNHERAMAPPPVAAPFWLAALSVLAAALIVGLRHRCGFMIGMVILVVTFLFAAPVALLIAAAVHLVRGGF